MTLATRCPACGTAFRVVSDQLRVSSGWVRCGRCSSSFDALEHLFRHASGRKAPAEVHPAGSAEAGAVDAPPPGLDQQPADLAQAPAPPLDGLLELPSPTLAETADPQPLIELSAVSDPGRAEVEADLPLPLDADAAQAEALVNDDAGEPAVIGQPEDPPPAAGVEGVDDGRTPHDDAPASPSSGAEAGLPVQTQADLGWARQDIYRPLGRPSFLRRAEADARWSHPATRTTLSLLLAILVVLLAAQAAVLWRDDLALRWPATRPMLEAACASLRCRVEAPRRIQALAVEASNLRSQPDEAVYRLEVTIRNRGDIEVLAPALELTLTDAAGQLYARKVLTPGELGLPSSRAIASGEELVVQAEVLTGSPAVAGYTIALFYP